MVIRGFVVLEILLTFLSKIIPEMFKKRRSFNNVASYSFVKSCYLITWGCI